MKHLTRALALLSLFAAAPAFASDVSSDRHFTETKSAQARSLQSLRTTAETPRASPRDNRERCACSCPRSADAQALRGEPGRH